MCDLSVALGGTPLDWMRVHETDPALIATVLDRARQRGR
jgi:hypothetical protein